MAYALDRRGQVWAWGSGLYGQLGNGYILVGVDEPVRVRKLSQATPKSDHNRPEEPAEWREGALGSTPARSPGAGRAVG